MNIIDLAINKYKATLATLFLIFITGIITYQNIPKEQNPDVEIPFINVNLTHDGISPEDSENLLVKPLEKEFSGIENVKNITATAKENGASISIEFEAGTDSEKSFSDVRDAVTRSKGELPNDTKEPIIKEVSMADTRPVLSIMLSGKLSESAKLQVARDLEDEIEKIKEVLGVDIIGDRKETIDVIINPRDLETYNINFQELVTLMSNSNKLVAVGTLDNGKGSYTFKIPGKINDLYTLNEIPIKEKNKTVIKLKDVATFKKSYEDRTSIARFNGENTIALNVKKKSGENIINTIEKIKEVVEKRKNIYPSTLKIDFINDTSSNIKEMLYDLENNILSSIILVFMVVVAFLGFRTGILVSIAIPGAFLMGILLLSGFGLTINVVVLFALIMSVGMLVDGAIVVTEFADKKMSEGIERKEAYKLASKRMSWPIISSTATTLAAFMPLMFWPGMVGEFMKYLPITVILTLSSSLIMALIFIPTIGAFFSKKRAMSKQEEENIIAVESGDFKHIHGLEKVYYSILKQAIKYPILTLATIIMLSMTIFKLYANSSHQVEFFPGNEPTGTSIIVKTKGDLSIYERSEYVKEVEKLLTPYYDKIEDVYTNIYAKEERIAKIDLNFIDWSLREKGEEIIKNLRHDISKINGLIVEIEEQARGPSSGKALQLNISSYNKNALYSSIPNIKEKLDNLGYLIELEDTLPVNGLDWEYKINREKIAQYGISIDILSNYIKLFTTGIKLTDFTPEYTKEEVDVKIKVPSNYKKIDILNSIMIQTKFGMVPITQFVELNQSKKISSITRINEKETVQIKANVKFGININDKMTEIKELLSEINQSNPLLEFSFKGDQESQKEAGDFLQKAFLIALAVMFIILVSQFNGFHQPFIILSAIIFSTSGVLLLLYLTKIPFGIVMGGIGIISLAGIVVNNNIVLIDTFNYKVNEENKQILTSILETGIQRFRPVFLTTITTILGLLPMAFKLNIDIFQGSLTFSPPSSLMWYQLALSVVGGLSFASVVTLILTPCLLVIFNKGKIKKEKSLVN